MSEPKVTFEHVKGSVSEAAQEALSKALLDFGKALQEAVTSMSTDATVSVVLVRAGGVSPDDIDLDLSVVGVPRAKYEEISGE